MSTKYKPIQDLKQTKQREVRSEERNSKYCNPRRKLIQQINEATGSKNNNHQIRTDCTKYNRREISNDQNVEWNKNLYYLQFLSGQAVWSNAKEDNLERIDKLRSKETTQESELAIDKKSSFDILNQPIFKEIKAKNVNKLEN